MAISDKIKEVQKLADAEAAGDAAAHISLLNALQELRLEVETPAETTSRLNFQNLQNICLRIALEYKLYEAISARDGKPVTAAELAKDSGADELLIIRIMRVLTAIGLADEVGESSYAANATTRFQTQPGAVGAIKHHYDLDMAMGGRLVDYMRGPGLSQFPSPESSGSGSAPSLFHFTFGAHNIFALLQRHPEQKAAFDAYMAGRPRSKPWFESYPAAQKLANARGDGDGDAVLLVDIAGGLGHETVRFRQSLPKLRGRCVVQDLPLTLDKLGDAGLPAGVETMRYDFFTEQPIKGARAYFYRDIMHNWPDAACVTILARTAEAMDPDYSTLLIDDYVLPARNAPLRAAEMDILMWTHLSALERTMAQWEALFKEVGLEVVGVWPVGRGEESVLEVRRVRG